MDLASSADNDLPGMAGKPWEFIGWRTNKVQPADHPETTDFKYDATWIGKGVAM